MKLEKILKPLWKALWVLAGLYVLSFFGVLFSAVGGDNIVFRIFAAAFMMLGFPVYCVLLPWMIIRVFRETKEARG